MENERIRRSRGPTRRQRRSTWRVDNVLKTERERNKDLERANAVLKERRREPGKLTWRTSILTVAKSTVKIL
jgi:hypothetical protein